MGDVIPPSGDPYLLPRIKRHRLDEENACGGRNNNSHNNNTRPMEYVIAIFHENGYSRVLDDDPVKFTASLPFVSPNAMQVAAYQMATVKAAKSGNIHELRILLSAGISLDCCNRFGETLISSVCRQGNADVVRFLVQEARVSLFIRDDFGRTVLHDAFWTKEPNFDMVLLLLQHVPDFLLVPDVRGHTPTDYIRREHWDEWITFFIEQRQMIRLKLSSFLCATQSCCATKR